MRTLTSLLVIFMLLCSTTAHAAWLTGWAKRVKLTIDNTDIDATLTQFPVLINVSTSSGRNSEDVSFVFDELTSDANRNKIAVTQTDGTTELYVEIEEWDDANETATLHVSLSSWTVSSSADTDIYLYYDSTHAANTARVGDTNDVVAENVWDTNFVGVYHKADGASSSAIYDSTSNDQDGTKGGAGTPTEVDGGIAGQEQDYDGSEIINLGQGGLLDGAGAATVEAWVEWDTLGVDDVIVRKWRAGNQAYFFALDSGDVGELQLAIKDGGANLITKSTNASLATATQYHIVFVWTGGSGRVMYRDKTSLTLSDDTGGSPTAIDVVTEDAAIGARDNGGSPDMHINGRIDELRISDSARVAAWVNATYETLTDDLLDWGTEELEPTGAQVIIIGN